jgi:large subunit ribosomal protein L18
MAKRTSRELRERRHNRLRRRVFGEIERPRLCVFRSNIHIYAQVIDDVAGHTLVSASTAEKELRQQMVGQTKRAQAEFIGKVIADRALQAGITKIVFDRGGFMYHGRVKILAEAAREAGLSF